MTQASLLRRIDPLLGGYLAAGAPALLLDIAVMELLVDFHWPPLLARALSAALGTLFAFFLHRRFTFARLRDAKTKQGQPVPFGTLQAAAGALNYGVFTRVLYFLPHPVGMWGRLFALGCGALAGAFFNFGLLERLLPESGAKAAPEAGSARPLRRLLMWIIIVILIAQATRGQVQDVMNWPGGITYPIDPPEPDSWVRLTQVRQWIHEGFSGFFDHNVRGTNAPFGGVPTPWTRPVDALVALFFFVMPHGLPENTRLMLAAAWMPACVTLGSIALMARAARRQLDNLHMAGLVGLQVLCMGSSFYFSSGDADHHSVLAMLWCGVIAMMMARGPGGPAMRAAGAMLGLMVWISPEGLMLAAAAYGLLCLDAIIDPRRMRGFAEMCAAAALVATAGLFIEIPAAEALTKQVYDSLSIVYVALLWFCAAAAVALMLFFRLELSAPARFCAASLAGAAVMIAMKLLYPRFFLGPLADADPFVFKSFFPMIGEMQPLYKAPPANIIRSLTQPLMACALIVLVFWKGRPKPERVRRLMLLAGLCLFTALMMSAAVRWTYYVDPPAIVAICMTLPGLCARTPGFLARHILRPLPRQARAYAVLGITVVVANFIGAGFSAQLVPATHCRAQMRYALQTGALQKVFGDTDMVLLTSEDAGGDALFFTPYRIIASNYHREAQGMKDMRAIYEAKDAATAKKLLDARHVGAMLYCLPSPLVPDDSWMQGAETGKDRPKWLVRVPGVKFMDLPGKRPVLFRVEGR